MTDPVFQQAYDSIRRSHSDEAWYGLTPRQITEAIYREMRRIDAIAAKSNGLPPAASASDAN
jgi:hypothetical protein